MGAQIAEEIQASREEMCEVSCEPPKEMFSAMTGSAYAPNVLDPSKRFCLLL